MAKKTRYQRTHTVVSQTPPTHRQPARTTPPKKTEVREKTGGNTVLGMLSAVILIAYGYVTVLTPNWRAFDSNAPKFYTFAILNLVVGGLVFFIKDFRKTHRSLFGFFFNKIGIAYSVMLVFALLSFAKVINVEEGILHFFKIFTAFAGAWMVSVFVVYNPKSITALAAAMTFMLFIDAVQTFEGVSKIVKGIGTDGTIKGSYSNKNILASAIFIKLPFAVWLFYFQRNWLRIFGGIGLLIATIAVLFMSTRAFYLATMITMAVLLVYAALNYFLLKKKETAFKAGGHLVLVLLAFGVFTFVQQVMYPKESRDATSFTGRLSTITDTDNMSNNLRLTAWKTSVEMIQKDPLLGVGIGNWKVRYLEYENKYSPHYIYMYKNHNDFLEIPAETGILGGLAFVAIFVLAAFYFAKATYFEKNSEKEKWFFLPLFGLFAYSFDAFFNFPQDRPEIQSLFSIYVGIAVGLAVLYFSKRKTPPPSVNGFLAALVGIVFISVNFANVVVQKMYFDSSKIQRMVKEESMGVRKSKSPSDFLIDNYPRIPNLTAVAEPVDVEKARYLIDEKKFEKAREILQSIDYSPWDARKEYFTAVSYFSSDEKNFDSIRKYAHAAREIKPNFFGAANMETFALNNLGREPESIEIWKSFLETNKNEAQAFSALAHLYEKNNQIDSAKTVMDAAFELFPDNQTIIDNRNKLTSRQQQDEFLPMFNQAVQTYVRKEYAKAIPEFTAFLEKVPAHIEGYGLRAISYYHTGDYKKALDDMATQERLGASLSAMTNNVRASCYYMLGDRANAKKYYELSAQQGNADARTNLQQLKL
ncbi:MAG: O-antigen ligase family protein [Capnocytophaga sp.]|nr:O-antigen ligase family protein [Capnocytophaga sp.]